MAACSPFLQVDAFTQDPFGGEPGAIVVLEGPRNAAWLQAVAAEMNLSETAFPTVQEDEFDLRWFTPAVEVDAVRPRDAGQRARAVGDRTRRRRRADRASRR